MPNLLSPSEMPIGLGMAFAENADAMHRYANMSDAERQAVIDRAHNIKSREEMHAYVRSLAE
jgi:hypothetical protein